MNTQLPSTTSTLLSHITHSEVVNALPPNLRSSATQGLVDLINNVSLDPEAAKHIRDNFISYTGVLKEGKFKVEDYLNAVAYVSYKIMGATNEEAYGKTFPTRYANLIARNTPKKDIASYVSAFHKGKLVNLILEQTLVPTWVLNHDIYQQAINVQAELMLDDKVSDKVRSDAANSILNHLKKPEAASSGLNLNLNVSEGSGMSQMEELLTRLAQAQRTAIENGSQKVIDIAATPLVPKDNDETNY